MVEVAAVAQIVFRSFLLLLPVAVAALACRRLVLSRSENAWIYAAMTLLAGVAAIGLVPWTIGMGAAKPMILGMALVSPVFWLGVVLLCDVPGGHNSYDELADDDAHPIFQTHHSKLEPLVLESPNWPDMPKAQFVRQSIADVRPANNNSKKEAVAENTSTQVQGLLSVVRNMRSNPNSEARRPKLLPPPRNRASLSEMPFIR